MTLLPERPRLTVPAVVPALLRVLDPPRAGWPALGRVCVPLVLPLLPTLPERADVPLVGRCWRTVVPELLPVEGRAGRVTVLPLLRVLDPPRLTWPELLLPVLGRVGCVLRLGCELRLGEDMEGWLLRGAADPRPLVLPEYPEPRVWEDGADIEVEGRLPPLLRELPPPDPPRELLPPLG